MASLMRRLAIAVFSIAAAACNPAPPDETDYATRIANARASKDAQFLKAPEPVPASRKPDLLPLEYFPIDPAYNVPAVLKPFDEVVVIDMVTSTGSVDKMRRVGSLEFLLHGEPAALTAFVPAAAQSIDRLFVPFSDLTSGVETYPAGRYLDLDRTPTGIYQVDFNLAYNPNCYFNPLWVCPLPPRENRLEARVEAGERVKPAAVKG
jgi:uncharacterized protein (DUF1684 family)